MGGAEDKFGCDPSLVLAVVVRSPKEPLRERDRRRWGAERLCCRCIAKRDIIDPQAQVAEGRQVQEPLTIWKLAGARRLDTVPRLSSRNRVRRLNSAEMSIQCQSIQQQQAVSTFICAISAATACLASALCCLQIP